MIRRVPRILCILFLVLNILCVGLLLFSMFSGNSHSIAEVVDSSRMEYRMIGVYGLAVLIGFVLIFVFSVIFRQFGKKWVQIAGKVVSLLSAALALCISFTAIALLCFPQNSITADYLYDSSRYSAFRLYESLPEGALLSPGNLVMSKVSVYRDRPNERTRVCANLKLEDVDLNRIAYVSLRCIAYDANGSAYGAFYLPVEELKFRFGSSIMVTCYFPPLPEEGVLIQFELCYYDENNDMCYCYST